MLPTKMYLKPYFSIAGLFLCLFTEAVMGKAPHLKAIIMKHCLLVIFAEPFNY